jgi:hypothetical protein
MWRNDGDPGQLPDRLGPPEQKAGTIAGDACYGETAEPAGGTPRSIAYSMLVTVNATR